MQCNYNSFIQIINFHGLFRNDRRCRKTGACRILVPLRYGRDMEGAARSKYINVRKEGGHRNCKVMDCGLRVKADKVLSRATVVGRGS